MNGYKTNPTATSKKIVNKFIPKFSMELQLSNPDCSICTLNGSVSVKLAKMCSIILPAKYTSVLIIPKNVVMKKRTIAGARLPSPTSPYAAF